MNLLDKILMYGSFAVCMTIIICGIVVAIGFATSTK
jgi:hypothetical protein